MENGEGRTKWRALSTETCDELNFPLSIVNSPLRKLPSTSEDGGGLCPPSSRPTPSHLPPPRLPSFPQFHFFRSFSRTSRAISSFSLHGNNPPARSVPPHSLDGFRTSRGASTNITTTPDKPVSFPHSGRPSVFFCLHLEPDVLFCPDISHIVSGLKEK